MADPTSVMRNRQLGQPWLEFYLHGLGPLLQAVDSVLIHRSFRRPSVALVWLVGVIGANVLWIEGPVQRLNDSPQGGITSGLPYRFLNDLPFDDRVMFYAANIAVAVILLGFFTALAFAVRRRRPAPITL